MIPAKNWGPEQLKSTFQIVDHKNQLTYILQCDSFLTKQAWKNDIEKSVNQCRLEIESFKKKAIERYKSQESKRKLTLIEKQQQEQEQQEN